MKQQIIISHENMNDKLNTEPKSDLCLSLNQNMDLVKIIGSYC